MPEDETGNDKTDAENKVNRDEIANADATEDGARGNRHSEPEPPVAQDAPPPLPH